MRNEENYSQNDDIIAWEQKNAGTIIQTHPGWKRGDPIGYVTKNIPDFKIPTYEGERYTAYVPDTLDLQEMAALGIHGLTGPTDPLADFETYFFVYFLSNPPMMQHSFDSHCQSKLMESLPLMRIISGSDLNAHVDRRWMELALHQQDSDGMVHIPTAGRPWALLGMEEMLPARAKTVEQIISPFYCGRLLSALMLYYRRDGESLWAEAAHRLVDGLADLAVYRDNYAYYAPHVYWAERGNTDDPAKNSTHVGLEVRGIVLGLTHVYRETGYEPALRLAQKLISYILDVCRSLDENGRFNTTLPNSSGTAHFHSHAYTLLALLEYARVTGDATLVDLVRKGYQYGKSQGNVLLGYFPECVNSYRLEHSELCEVADMIAIGLKLPDAGVGDYWDEVERWVRNMFTEGQLTQTDWINRLHLAGMEGTRKADVLLSKIDESYQTVERVAERNLGAFAGWPKANDWYAGQGMGIMHCCTGNATRAIYYVWDHILTHKDGKLRVNLLLNRSSPWADVDSHIPYVGQVDVKIKEVVDLQVRAPEWVTPGEVRMQVNGAERELSWEGRYAGIGDMKPGDVATMHFPINERTDTVWIEKEKYTLVRKGNDVVAIDPPGRYCPLYQRAHYRDNSTRWRKIERFVSKEQIHW